MFNFDNPFSFLLSFFAHLFSGNFGLSIIAMTVLIRFLLLPLFIKQEKQQKETQEKMNAMKPELTKIQDKMNKAKTPEEKMNIQKEMIDLRKKHNINFFSMGFMPVLLQAPILYGFYYTLTHTNLLDGHSFLWLQLSSNDIFIAVILGIFYLVQLKLVQKSNSANTNQPNHFTGLIYMFPLFMTSISLTVPSAIVLYWLVGCLFMILYKVIQQYKKHS